jgi:hypothetical protein
VVIEIAEVAELTVIENCLCVDWLPESATLARKLDVPVADGVPPIAPVEALRVRPAGSAPEAMLQVYDGFPPVACNVAEYAVPTVAPGSAAVVVMLRAVSMVKARELCAVRAEPGVESAA